jgi:hypothetical protein
MKVHNLTIDSSQRDVSVYPDSNNYVVTLENPIYDVSEIRLVSAHIPTPQTPSPNSLILRLSSGSDEFNQSVYLGIPKDSLQKGTPHFTGHILLNGGASLIYNGSDDPLIHRFHSGSHKSIKELGIEFMYLNSGVLTRYNFETHEHTLKFEIKCSTDKLENLSKVPEKVQELMAPINIPNESENVYSWKKEYSYIILIILVGLLLLSLMKRKQKPISG